MYTIRTTQEFDKDVKRCKLQGRNMQLLLTNTGSHLELFS